MLKNFLNQIRSIIWSKKGFALLSIIVVLGLLQGFIFSMGQWAASASSGGTSTNFLPVMMDNAEIASELPPPPPLSLPEIVSFSASQFSIENGQNTDLNWVLDGVIDTVEIDNNIGDVSDMTSLTISPTVTTTYTLTVGNDAGSVSESLTINVTEPPPMVPPTIHSFEASDTTIEEGESVTLTWSVEYYESLVLNQGINDVSMQNSIVVSPTESTTYRLKAANPYGEVTEQINIEVEEVSNQIVIYDWNKDVTTDHHGFPRNQPPDHNYDWTSPINYAEGTLYVRAQINSIPVNQPDMYLQFCFWQELNGYNFGLETCLTTKNVPGHAGSVVCWHQTIDQMWKLNNEPLDWDRPRYRVAVPIKVQKQLNGVNDKYPVSDYNGWNWNGENPNHWYPLDMRFTAIVVEKGGTFSGWEDYGGCSSN